MLEDVTAESFNLVKMTKEIEELKKQLEENKKQLEDNNKVQEEERTKFMEEIEKKDQDNSVLLARIKQSHTKQIQDLQNKHDREKDMYKKEKMVKLNKISLQEKYENDLNNKIVEKDRLILDLNRQVNEQRILCASNDLV